MKSCLDTNCDSDQEVYQRDVDDLFPYYKIVDHIRSSRNSWKRLHKDIKVNADENINGHGVGKPKKLFLPILIIASSTIISAIISRDNKKKLKGTKKLFNRNSNT
ncbi:hypothetical protein KGM_212499 [Danaus plexippus plexippus]|uniref:Uncharacterized protein n=1 Tax=Danaus plexippus plexippus TaxID=278856 RepID=A0A212F3S9_DANPL|nr:hypothetical protein KGM_212499 [Danaus plexippus plexippus]